MQATEVLAQSREAYARRAWGDAYEGLRALDGDVALAPADLERLATAAYLTGHTDHAVTTLERLHHLLVDEGDAPGAVRWAFWLAILLFQRGDHAQGGGWLARADHLCRQRALQCAEEGLLLVPAALQALDNHDGETARRISEQIAAIADRYDDRDVAVLGLLGRGQALIATGEVGPGIAMLDEAMLTVTTADVYPVLAGIVYCAVILACRDVFDLRRAREWTAVLTRWCDAQQDLKPYRGQCLIHRSEIMQLHGDWRAAMHEVEAACDHLAGPPADPVMGMARYQQAELLRLRGDLTGAEAAYRQASEFGHPPQPGLALLWLAQGRVDDATAAIRRVAQEAEGDRVRRARVLAAYVDILLVTGDEAAAASGVDELEVIAADFDSTYLEALAAQCRGAVLLARGDAAGACLALERAFRAWQDLEAPYEAARVRLLMARAYRRLSDHATADMELDAARRVFRQLHAAPALAEVAEVARTAEPARPGGLTARELEVLRLVATGATNREVADALVISDRTVARHLSNLFTKLGISSRAAATAWAYEHDLA